MSEEKKNTPATGEEEASVQEAPQDEKKQQPNNIVTQFYDRMNISVKTLDIAIIVLGALIILLALFGSKIHLGF